MVKCKIFFLKAQEIYIDNEDVLKLNKFLETVKVSQIEVTAHNDIDVVYVFYDE